MAYCSACGSQLTAAARFCANCGVEAAGSTAIVAAQAPAPVSQEQILYENTAGQLVSTTRAVLSGVTYPIASISSVRMTTIAGSCWGPVLLVLGVITLAIGLSGGSAGGAVAGGIMLLIGIAILATPKERTIVLVTTGGETMALKSTDHALIATIVEALNKAIVARG